MKRILIVSNYAWTIFNFRRRLIASLVHAGYEVFVQTEFDGYQVRLGLNPDHVLPLDIDRKGINPLRDLRTFWSIFGAVRRLRADICLFFTIKPVVYGGFAASILRVPFASNVTGLGAAFMGRWWLGVIARMLLRSGLKKACVVFFQNREDQEFFIQQRIVNHDRHQRLPGSGVDLLRFRATPYPTNPAPLFLLLARLIWDKGVGEFVEAAKVLKSRYPAARFQILGPLGVLNPSAIDTEQMEEWVEEGTVEYLGETDDVRRFIAAADCVVLPSSYREGVPRALLEAAAMARPVITTDNVGCRDAVENDRTGMLCKVKDVADLVQKMESMIQLPLSARAEMGRSGRRKIEREFDEEFVLVSYLAAIEGALTARVV